MLRRNQSPVSIDKEDTNSSKEKTKNHLIIKTNQTAENQRQRLLEAMRHKPYTTFEIRHQLDIVMPAPRIHELRNEQGYNIQMHWNTGKNPGGGKHCIARYVLLPGIYKEERSNVE